MKSKYCIQALAVLGFLAGSTGLASAMTTIDFSEVSLGTSNPVIGDVTFSAGDVTGFADAYTSDFWSVGNPYLASGFDPDGLYDTFIKAHISGADLFSSVSLNILAESLLPGSTTFWVQALLNGSQVAATSLTVSDQDYHLMTISPASGFDTLHIYDDLDNGGLGEFFHIDTFTYETTGEPIPEPATMLLMATGVAGMAFTRRRRKP